MGMGLRSEDLAGEGEGGDGKEGDDPSTGTGTGSASSSECVDYAYVDWEGEGDGVDGDAPSATSASHPNPTLTVTLSLRYTPASAALAAAGGAGGGVASSATLVSSGSRVAVPATGTGAAPSSPTNVDSQAGGTGTGSGAGATNVRLTITPPAWVVLPRGMRQLSIQLVPPTSATPGTGTGTGAGDAASPQPPVSTRTSTLPHGLASPDPTTGTVTLRLPLRAAYRGMPGDDLSVCVAASYTNDNGEVRATTTTFALPLALAATVVPPINTNAGFKLTLDTDQPQPVSLLALFADLTTHQPPGERPSGEALSRIQAKGAAVLSLAYRAGGGTATILASKAGGRYRLQSDTLEGLSLVTGELARRLKAATGASVSYSDPLPLADVFRHIDDHHAARLALLAAYSRVNDRAHEYRLVAKRLLVRWRDAAPQSLNGLDKLMGAVQAHVMQAGDAVEAHQHALAAAGNRLSCVISLLALLIAAKFQLSEASSACLRRCLSPLIVDTLDQGWEEATEASLAHAKKQLAAKGLAAAMSAMGAAAAAAGGAGGSAAAVATASGVDGGESAAQSLSLPPDTSRLKSLLATVLDALATAPAALAPTMLEQAFAPPPKATGASGAAGGKKR